MTTKTVDVVVENHGTLFLLRPLTDTVREWLDENIAEPNTWFGDALVIEPRFVEAVVEGLQSEGFEVQ